MVFSLVELIATCVLVSAVTVMAHRKILQPHYFFSSVGMRDLHILGPYGLHNRVARNFEELVIREFFQDKRNGTFLDVGSNHYHNENNTYYLETAPGWSGVAVDAFGSASSISIDRRSSLGIRAWSKTALRVVVGTSRVVPAPANPPNASGVADDALWSSSGTNS